MSQFNVQQRRPLIPREQTYVLDRKLVSIHSYDRDVKKWPNSNHFAVELPEDLRNIQSMRLLNIQLPSNQYIFSNEYQNTKLKVTIPAGDVEITIDEGSYTPSNLAREIQTKLNKTIASRFSLSTYNNFRCEYNSVSNTFWFGNLAESFTLKFGEKLEYKFDCTQQLVWNNYKRWGLPAYLGYKKRDYEATLTPPNVYFTNSAGNPFGFDYEMEDGSGNEWLTAASTNHIVNLNEYNSNPLDPSGICNLDIMGEDYIYMELAKWNSMDEIEPYSERSNACFNNDYAGKVKCAFAKIPVQCTPYSQVFDSTRAYIANISHYNPPLERVKKLEFKFRYHDGRLVDFKCLPFSFTMEFNMLRDEQLRDMIIRVPPLYCL